MPLVFLGASLYSITFQSFRDVTEAASFQVLSENPSHNLGFFLINDEVAIGVLCISQEVVMINLDLSVLITELKSQLYVLRKCLRFLLGQ